METQGKLINVTRDIMTGRLNVTFQIATEPIDELNTLSSIDELDITAKKCRKKRSLDANAYFHVLVGKIADVMTISKAHAKNIMICRYGQPQLLPDGEIMVYKSNAPVEYIRELESIHMLPVKHIEENGKLLTYYTIFRRSSDLDTKEMSILIDGTVACAKELGIETMTPNELARLKSAWKNSGVEVV